MLQCRIKPVRRRLAMLVLLQITLAAVGISLTAELRVLEGHACSSRQLRFALYVSSYILAQIANRSPLFHLTAIAVWDSGHRASATPAQLRAPKSHETP